MSKLLRYSAPWAAALLAVTASAQNSPTTAPSASSAAAPAAAAPAAPPSPEQEKEFLTNFGFYLAKQARLKEELALTNADIDLIAAGMKLSLVSNDTPDATKMQAMMTYLQTRAETTQKAAGAKQAADSAAFFADLDKKGVKKTSDGLYYEIITPGASTKAAPNQIATVSYTGKLIDGTVFDKTDNKETRDLPVKDDGIIKGWTEGVQLIGKGGEVKLYIPAALAFEDKGVGPIPPNATLIFDITVTDLKDAPPPAPAGASGGGLSPELLKQLGLSPNGAPPASGGGSPAKP